MNLLSISNLTVKGRDGPLFSNVTFGLEEEEKAALIGRNGTGKSTLLNVLSGSIQPDEGTIVMNREAGVSYLPQTPLFNPGDTIRSHIFKSKSQKLKIIREYETVCTELGRNDSAQHRYDELSRLMEDKDLWNYESQVHSILTTLGITDMNRTMGTLSGGMIKKITLAQVLVEDTKLLLLDEPTNHLDVTTIDWLQNFLAETRRSVLMVTHDRYFLDAVCTKIYELAHHTVKLYQGNYSTYLEKKETETEVEQNTDRRIEAVLRIERDWLMRGPCGRATKAKARIRHDYQLINREKFQADQGFSFEVKGRRLGGNVLELHHVTKNFPKGCAGAEAGNTTPVIRDFSYTFSGGQKIGIFGSNGTGKSTLLNIITGVVTPDNGTIVKGLNTQFGYYQQNPVFKDTSLLVIDYIKEAAEMITMNDGKLLSAGQFLEEFGFIGEIQYSPVSILSGGERKRLFLVRLLMENPNFLILDEPTNDFDIFTMNILEQFLTGFRGCLLVVSHDRYFMDKVADTLFILEDDGSISGFVGKCSEYIDYLKEKTAAQEDAERVAKKTAAAMLLKETEKSTGEKLKKKSFKEQREFEQLEKDIAQMETRRKELESLMNNGETDFKKINSYNSEYQTIGTTLEQKYGRWEELA
jgi:ABC transport system ATP-binding/permease protein